jgi:hypothetical protein
MRRGPAASARRALRLRHPIEAHRRIASLISLVVDG